MQPLFYVMAILGCGDGDAGCAPARVEPIRYATVAACRAQLPAALARNTDLSYPVIAADCRASSPLKVAQGRVAPRG